MYIYHSYDNNTKRSVINHIQGFTQKKQVAITRHKMIHSVKYTFYNTYL